ncbi:interferon-inducible GTPase 5-like isoform X2 [Hemicordylus capensis]|nr:interferon-inducible GTPase 5-like isoform X2 [Hemicordylus capensis]XP_053122682.1 interferon-inducible GTPase 5-like isoform X2 [Hemicordylus capensis]XP_053122683.1 interferon-inducible GTPase 5-like isoform X2 [Hemicordylus capensis]XP_053122684.1 interferon-inducible GTPase 5-like isoform X2 [Hemicordylus capensis]
MGITITKSLIRNELGKLKDLLKERDISSAASETQKQMDLLENATLNIAITGMTGAGKSSFVNALREMEDDDEDAAETGVTQTTMERKAYQHPTSPKVTFWDLPGIGTAEFPVKKYLEMVKFSEYDLFIIVAGEHFTEHEINLAREIQKLKKNFYYVRTKVDVSMDSEKRKRNFCEEKTLEKIRNDCCKNLIKAGESSPRVFLISRWDLSLYDFPLLQKALEGGLDDMKRHVLIMSMPTFSRDMLEKKKAAMKELIWSVSFLSCAFGTVPVPGLSLACDLTILACIMNRFYKMFGLDEGSLQRLAKRVGKPVEVLKSAITRTLHAGEIKRDFVIDCLTRSALCVTLTGAELVLDFIPMLGSVAGGVLSFVTTFYLLSSFLDDVVEDAEKVGAKAAER